MLAKSLRRFEHAARFPLLGNERADW